MLGVGTVVSSHTLETSCKNAFFSGDSFERLWGIILKTLKFATDFRQGIFDIFSVLFCLFKMASPFFSISQISVNLKLVSYFFDFNLPFFFWDIRLDDCILRLVCFHLLGQFLLHIASTQINIFINVFIRVLPVDDISEISTAIHLISVQILSIIICSMAFLLYDAFSEFEFVFYTGLGESQQYFAHFFTATRLQFSWLQIELKSDVLHLNKNVLACCHWVIVLVPALNLMVINWKQPRYQTNKKDKLFGCVLSWNSKESSWNWFKTPTLIRIRKL